MVAPVYNFDTKILPEGSAKLRWVGRRAGDLIASAVQWKEKTWAAQPKLDRFYVFLGVKK